MNILIIIKIFIHNLFGKYYYYIYWEQNLVKINNFDKYYKLVLKKKFNEIKFIVVSKSIHFQSF